MLLKMSLKVSKNDTQPRLQQQNQQLILDSRVRCALDAHTPHAIYCPSRDSVCLLGIEMKETKSPGDTEIGSIYEYQVKIQFPPMSNKADFSLGFFAQDSKKGNLSFLT